MERETTDAAASEPDHWTRLREVGIRLATGGVGFGLANVWGLFLGIVVILAVGDFTRVHEVVISPVALALGMGSGVAVYLYLSRHDRSFIDVRRPTLRDGLYAVVGLLALLAFAQGIEVLMHWYGVEAAEHSTVQTLQTADPNLSLYLVGASLVFIGPAEEIVFRNLVQKRLTETFTPARAIALASVVFAAIHFQAYATGTPGQQVTSLAVVFVLSLLLGVVYHRTENLLVPAFVHGGYDAVVFGSTYLEQVTALSTVAV